MQRSIPLAVGRPRRKATQLRPRRSWVRFGILGLLALAALHPLAAQENALEEVLGSHAVRAVIPPSSAVDFTLPELDGGERSLSEWHGKWVLLTFLASWCGPCRHELPSLDALHHAWRKRGVEVLGVSVDSDRAALETFVEDLEVSFPILWDRGGTVAGLYRATSIPMTYLIDPRGAVFGVALGSRDWTRAEQLLSAALEAVPRDTELPALYVAADRPVELPRRLDPPTGVVALAGEAPRLDEPFELEVRIQWAGDLSQYLLQPPRVAPREGLEALGVSGSTSSRDGRSEVTYRLRYVAREPAVYALDPVEIRYTPRFENDPRILELAGPEVEISPRTIAGLSPRAFAVAAGGGLVAMAAVGLATAGLRRRRSASAVAVISPYEEWSDLLREARSARTRGEMTEYLESLADLDGKLSGDGEDEALIAALERARYGGQVPPSAVLDAWERRIERRIGEAAPSPEAAERARLELRDPQEADGEARV